MTCSNGVPAAVVQRFKLSRYECERYGASREILYSAFSSQKGNEAVADLLPCCSAVTAANLHQAPMLWIVKRVTVEFKDNPAAWKFAEDVKAELERLEQVSFVNGRAKAKKDLEGWLKSDWAKMWRKSNSVN